MSGATSELPGKGGLDPAAGIDLTYFTGPDGFSRPMVPPKGAELHWVDGLTMLIGQAARAFELLFGEAPPPPDPQLRGLLVTDSPHSE